MKQETCANCGKVYSQHLKGTYCRIGSNLKWFPQHIADAIVKSTQKTEEFGMSEINNFDVLKRMSAENKRIWLAATITEMNYNAKKGSEVTFGIEGNVLFDIQHGKKNAVCLLWSVEEFKAMRSQMQIEAEAPASPATEEK